MITTYVFHDLLLGLVEMGANALLRLLGGPDHVPNTNDDFVWF